MPNDLDLSIYRCQLTSGNPQLLSSDYNMIIIDRVEFSGGTAPYTGWAKKTDHFKCITPGYDNVGRRSIY